MPRVRPSWSDRADHFIIAFVDILRKADTMAPMERRCTRPIARADASLMTPKAFVIAGPASGVGKTTVTLGLMAALRRRDLTVQPFKLVASRVSRSEKRQ
jgi:Mrp family chromosome partitioning ATPase